MRTCLRALSALFAAFMIFIPASAAADLLNDVWAYYVDTQTWEQLHPSGDGPPGFHGVPGVYDPVDHRMLLGTQFQLNLEMGAEAWAPLDKPEGLIFPWYYAHSSTKRQTAFCPSLDGMCWWNFADDTWGSGTMTSWAWTGRIGSFAVDDDRDRLVDFGRGRLIEYKLDANNNAVAAQLPLLGDVPLTYDFHGAAIDGARNRMIIFGGSSGEHAVYAHYEDDTFEMDLETDTWEAIRTKSSPSPRGQYGHAWDPLKRRMYLVCGLYRTSFDFSTVSTYNDVWVYDSRTQTWNEEFTKGPRPPHRRQPSTVFDPVNRRIIMYGGERLNPPASSRSVLKLPKNGQKLGGNSVTVMAELSQGRPEETASVLFQYRLPSITGSWLSIPPSGQGEENPDSTHPYFIHWDVTALPQGPVDLRAIATSIGNLPDQAAEFITVEISHSNPNTTETLMQQGRVMLSYLGGEGFGEVGSADVTGASSVRLRHGPNTLAEGTVVNMTFVNASEFEMFENVKDNDAVLIATELTENAQPLTLVFNYPDTDQDGVVDGTPIREAAIAIYGRNSEGNFFRLENVVVDASANQVRGETTVMGHFILAEDVLPNVTFDAVKEYLLGLQQPGSLELLQADGNSDVILDSADLLMKLEP